MQLQRAFAEDAETLDRPIRGHGRAGLSCMALAKKAAAEQRQLVAWAVQPRNKGMQKHTERRRCDRNVDI